MVKNIKVFLTIFVTLAGVLVSGTALEVSAVMCPKGKVVNIYPTEEKVYVQLEGQSWHVLGLQGDNGLSEKLARVREAKRQGDYVVLTFPDSYDASCMVMDEMVATTNIDVKDYEDDDGQ